MEKIKFFIQKDKPICYDSTLQFIKEIKKALEKNGCEVELGRLKPEDFKDETIFSDLKTSGFSAIIGINSSLSTYKNEAGQYFLNIFDIPFYQIILDHPLYHHTLLDHPLENYHVICLDENHKKYIQRYYPHIRSVYVLSLLISPSVHSSEELMHVWEEKQFDLFFSGTYTSTKNLEETWKKLPKTIQQECWDLAQRMIETPWLTQEEVLWKMIVEKKKENVISDTLIKNAMSWYFLADTYVCAYYREKVITAVLKKGIPIHIVGHGWKNFQNCNQITSRENSCLCIHGEIPYDKTSEWVRKSKICLNVQPWFKAGIHDRILTAMGQGTCVLTDETPYMRKIFSENNTIYYYDLLQIDIIGEKINNLIKRPEILYQTADNALQYVHGRYTWEKQLADWLKTEFDFYE